MINVMGTKLLHYCIISFPSCNQKLDYRGMFIDIYTRATETLVETENQSRALLKQTFAIPIGIRVSF